MTLSDLITRLEGVTDGSRELDGLIIQALNPNLKISRDGEYCSTPNAGSPIQRYSTSVDAALTLIPEGLSYSLYHRKAGAPFVVVLNPGTQSVSARTLPLGICIAALKARVSVTL